MTALLMDVISSRPQNRPQTAAPSGDGDATPEKSEFAAVFDAVADSDAETTGPATPEAAETSTQDAQGSAAAETAEADLIVADPPELDVSIPATEADEIGLVAPDQPARVRTVADRADLPSGAKALWSSGIPEDGEPGRFMGSNKDKSTEIALPARDVAAASPTGSARPDRATAHTPQAPKVTPNTTSTAASPETGEITRRADQPVDTPPAMTRSSAPTSVELVLAHQRMAAAGETPVQTQKSKTDDPRMSEADLATGDLSKSRPKAQAQPAEQPVTAVRAPAVTPSESIWATAVTEPASVTVDASISSAAADDAVVAPVAAAQSDAPAVQQSVLAQSAAGRADVARHVAQQLAASIQVLQDGNLEIALNPEELGRVKIAISMQDAGVMITIQTDRGETMDLMRRNISMLEQAFRDMGHGSVDFSFQSDQQANADDQGSGSESNGLLDGLPQEMDPVERALALPSLSGLDIRV